ncbi:MAG: hypothetical protein M1831_000681 [Alyxoria varia]|nr:MAG: hypothetical protein M1831_000681 [Alyxoria varia]
MAAVAAETANGGDAAAASAPAAPAAPIEPRKVVYCGKALSANLRLLSTTAREKAAKDSERKAAKAARTAQKTANQRAAAKVFIKRVERNKRKYVTVISGLEKHGLDLKKVAKDLGKKFACGSSVTKANPGALAPTSATAPEADGGKEGGKEGKDAMVPSGSLEEITVQGDVAEEVREWIEEVYEGVVPEDNLEVVDVGKKKGGG